MFSAHFQGWDAEYFTKRAFKDPYQVWISGNNAVIMWNTVLFPQDLFHDFYAYVARPYLTYSLPILSLTGSSGGAGSNQEANCRPCGGAEEDQLLQASCCCCPRSCCRRWWVALVCIVRNIVLTSFIVVVVFSPLVLTATTPAPAAAPSAVYAAPVPGSFSLDDLKVCFFLNFVWFLLESPSQRLLAYYDLVFDL